MPDAARPRPAERLHVGTYARALVGTLGVILVITFASQTIAPMHYLTERFLLEQDLIVAALLTALASITLAVADRARWFACPKLLPWGERRDVIAIGTGALMVFAIALIGRQAVFTGFPLSMDEYWAIADGQAFAQGQPAGRIPADWREYADALYPTFATMRPEAGLVISDYLPINALVQMALGPMASPLLAAGSIALVASVARRIIPGEPRVPVMAAILLATSAQVVLTAMTPYAMSAHLFLNLAWLRLFLVRSPWAQGTAIVIGIAAMGLHQNAMFPLFALPFLLEAFLARRRMAALAHCAVLAGGFLAWASYDWFTFGWFGLTPPELGGSGANGMLGDLFTRLREFDLEAVTLMGANLLRAAVWQNPLTVPLVVLGAWRFARDPGMLRAMAAGIVLTCGFVFIVIPLQGHGWGYRYVHGLLGNMAILASVMLVRIVGSSEPGRRASHGRSWNALALTMTGLAIALLPLRAWQAHTFTAPYAAANAAIGGLASADIVIIDAPGHAYAIDLVRNDVFAQNRPLRMARSRLTRAQLERLCERYTVVRFDGVDASRFGLREYPVVVRGQPWPAMCERR